MRSARRARSRTYLNELEDLLAPGVELLRVVVDLRDVLRVLDGAVQVLVELPADVRRDARGVHVHILSRFR